MSDKKEYQYREFSSYNGFDRTVMIMGVPLLWAIGILTMSVFIMFIGFYFFQMMGFLFALLLLPLFFFLRLISHGDDKALDMLVLEMKFRLKRVAFKELGNTLIFSNDESLRPKNSLIEEFTNVKDFVVKREIQ